MSDEPRERSPGIGTRRENLRYDMLAASSRVHEGATHAFVLLDEACSSGTFPDSLADALVAVQAEAEFICTVYAPSEDVDEPQPVEFGDLESGWDFAAWMHEKATRMLTGAKHAADQWTTIADAVAPDGSRQWQEYLGPFVSGDLGDTPVNRLQHFEICLGEAQQNAKTIFLMLSDRLTAQAPAAS